MGLSGEHHDPWRLQPQGRPVPVEGRVQPAMLLLDADEPLPDRHPVWLRVAALVLAVGFLVTTTLMALATGGAHSPLTDAGDWRSFPKPNSATGGP
ncbi:MAG: hypothetical protein H6742_04995 [Alphaproteobacteria bacterium]|nr:hypothetical protein [Alphaproteobacteria bacterium]